MQITGVIALAFVLFFFGLIALFTFSGRKQVGIHLRPIEAFTRLRRSIGLSVEQGTRLHLSVGRGGVTGPESAVGFAGLSVLQRITRIVSVSDRPPVATAGDGALALLARDTMQATYRLSAEAVAGEGEDERVAGLTPFSYAAGAMPLIRDEQVSTNVLIGSFGNEVALMAEAGERGGSATLAGTDNLSGQAVLFAMAQDPLIGEEVFAGGAYLQSEGAHLASLRAQDVLRWTLVAVILAGSVLKFFGFF